MTHFSYHIQLQQFRFLGTVKLFKVNVITMVTLFNFLKL